MQAEINPARKSILVDFVENYVRLNSKEQQQFEATVQTEDFQEVIKIMIVYKAIGRGKGMQQGEIKIAKQDVLEVLELKFSQIPY